jgi:hypothetical protein
MPLHEITFIVKIQYETTNKDDVVCPSSMKENLFSAIENERNEGALTPSDISANWVEVEVKKEAESAVENHKITRPQPKKCNRCLKSLATESSVIREYISKEGGEPVIAEGHFENGEFEVDSFDGFGGGRYDLLDDSDKCENCEEII